MGIGFTGRISSSAFELLSSVHGTRKSFDLTQTQPSGFNSSQLVPSSALVCHDTGQFHQSFLPALSAEERWDLEGYFQLTYSLATVSLSALQTEPSLWDTYSPSLVGAFYRSLGDVDDLFTDNELTTAFENCAEVFIEFNQLQQTIRDDIFANQISGKEALVGILQLVKMAKEFGIEGESWWELRRGLWMAFVEPFQQHGWVSPGSDMFQKLFKQCINMFFDDGVQRGSWIYGVIGELNEWRKAKGSQELVAAERAMVALGRRVVISSAWQILKEEITNGGIQSVPEETFVCPPPDYTFSIDVDAQMSPGSRLRENERRKPLLNLRMRLAPSLVLAHSSLSRHAPSSSQPQTTSSTPGPRISSQIAFWHYSLANQFGTSPMSITPQNPPIFGLQGSSSKQPQTRSEDFVDTYLPEFGEFMDVDPLAWSGENGSLQLQWLENYWSSVMETEVQPRSMRSCKVGGNAIIDTGGQLWEMSDEDFGAFCGIL